MKAKTALNTLISVLSMDKDGPPPNTKEHTLGQISAPKSPIDHSPQRNPQRYTDAIKYHSLRETKVQIVSEAYRWCSNIPALTASMIVKRSISHLQGERLDYYIESNSYYPDTTNDSRLSPQRWCQS